MLAGVDAHTLAGDADRNPTCTRISTDAVAPAPLNVSVPLLPPSPAGERPLVVTLAVAQPSVPVTLSRIPAAPFPSTFPDPPCRSANENAIGTPRSGMPSASVTQTNTSTVPLPAIGFGNAVMEAGATPGYDSTRLSATRRVMLPWLRSMPLPCAHSANGAPTSRTL